MDIRKVIAYLSAFTFTFASYFYVNGENTADNYSVNILFENQNGVVFDDSSIKIPYEKISELKSGDKIFVYGSSLSGGEKASVCVNGIYGEKITDNQFEINVNQNNIGILKSSEGLSVTGLNVRIFRISVLKKEENQSVLYEKNSEEQTNDKIKISAVKFTDLKENDKIIFNVSPTKNDGSEELFFNSLALKISDGRAVIIADADLINALQKNGCEITGWNISVKSVVLEKAQQDVNFNLNKSVLFNDETITISGNETGNVNTGDTITIQTKDSGGSISVRNSDGDILKRFSAVENSVDFVIDSGNIDDVKNGIEISGNNVTVSGVVLKRKVVVNNSENNVADEQKIVLNSNKFTGALKGGKLKITNSFSDKSTASLFLNINSESGGVSTVGINVQESESVIKFSELNGADFNNLLNYGCYITGKNITVNKISIYLYGIVSNDTTCNITFGNGSENQESSSIKTEEKILSSSEITFGENEISISSGESILENLSAGSKIKVKAYPYKSSCESFIYFNGQGVAVKNDYAELTVDEKMLSQIRNNGLTITGQNVMILGGEGSGICFNYGDKTEEIYKGDKILGTSEINITGKNDLKNGDEIIVGFDKTNSQKSSEIFLGNFRCEINGNQGSLKVNNDNVNVLASAFICTGNNADIKKILVKSKEKEITLNESEYKFDDEKIYVPGEKFSSAKAGDIIRIKGGNTGCATITDGDGNICGECEKKSLNNGYIDFILTDDILANIKNKGIKITGENTVIREINLLENKSSNVSGDAGNQENESRNDDSTNNTEDNKNSQEDINSSENNDSTNSKNDISSSQIENNTSSGENQVSDDSSSKNETVISQQKKVTAPGKVSKVTAKTYENKINLCWKKVKNASGYCVYRYDYSKKKYVTAGYTSKTSFTAGKLKSGTRYTFAVKAYAKNGSKKIFGKKATVSANTKPFDVKLISIKPGSKKAVIKWKKSSTKGCTYRVYARISPKGKYRLVKNTSKTSATVTGLKTGKKYIFMVKSAKKISVKSGKKSTVLTLISKGTASKKTVKIR